MDCLPTRARAASRWSLVLVAAGCSLATSCAATNSELALLGAVAGVVAMDDDARHGLFDHVGDALLDELEFTIHLDELGERPPPVCLHELEGYRRVGIQGGDMLLYAPLELEPDWSATSEDE